MITLTFLEEPPLIFLNGCYVLLWISFSVVRCNIEQVVFVLLFKRIVSFYYARVHSTLRPLSYSLQQTENIYGLGEPKPLFLRRDFSWEKPKT